MSDPDQHMDIVSLKDTLLSNDEDIWRAVIRKYHSLLMNISFKIIRDRELALDIVQEAFIRLYNAALADTDIHNIKSWLCKVTVNVSIDSLNKNKVKEISFDQLPSHALESIDIDQGQEPSSSVEFGEISNIIHSLITMLPPRQQEVLLLYKIQELSAEEVSAILDISPKTVHDHYYQAREQLLKHLKKLYK